MSTIGQTSAQYAMRDPDVRLMLRVREGDSSAFAELVDRYQHRLIPIMAHLCGRADEAEDLAQEVFLRVYRARREYHPQAKFSTWFFTIANNVALNALRHRKRKPVVQFANLTSSGPQPVRPEERLVYDKGPPPERGLHHQELAEQIQQALAQLNERQRTAVVLNKFEDLSYEEIADVLGISAKAVKSLLSRARGQLRELLRGYVEHEQATVAAEAKRDE
jgi:RNA polymerase sigma-70 factor (ECF subfamily)